MQRNVYTPPVGFAEQYFQECSYRSYSEKKNKISAEIALKFPDCLQIPMMDCTPELLSRDPARTVDQQ